MLDNEREREREREREKLLWGNEIRVNSSEAFSGISRVPLNERQARGIECTVIDPEKRNLPAILKCAMAAFSCTVIMWNNTREKKKERGGGERERERRAMCHRYIEKFQRPFPRLCLRSSFHKQLLPCPFPGPFYVPPLPLTTEIDAGNAISSDSSAFILWCTFSLRPNDLSRTNLRICINTIGVDSRGNSSASQDSKLTEVCRQSYYLRAITKPRGEIAGSDLQYWPDWPDKRCLH